MSFEQPIQTPAQEQIVEYNEQIAALQNEIDGLMSEVDDIMREADITVEQAASNSKEGIATLEKIQQLSKEKFGDLKENFKNVDWSRVRKQIIAGAGVAGAIAFGAPVVLSALGSAGVVAGGTYAAANLGVGTYTAVGLAGFTQTVPFLGGITAANALASAGAIGSGALALLTGRKKKEGNNSEEPNQEGQHVPHNLSATQESTNNSEKFRDVYVAALGVKLKNEFSKTKYDLNNDDQELLYTFTRKYIDNLEMGEIESMFDKDKGLEVDKINFSELVEDIYLQFTEENVDLNENDTLHGEENMNINTDLGELEEGEGETDEIEEEFKDDESETEKGENMTPSEEIENQSEQSQMTVEQQELSNDQVKIMILESIAASAPDYLKELNDEQIEDFLSFSEEIIEQEGGYMFLEYQVDGEYSDKKIPALVEFLKDQYLEEISDNGEQSELEDEDLVLQNSYNLEDNPESLSIDEAEVRENTPKNEFSDVVEKIDRQTLLEQALEVSTGHITTILTNDWKLTAKEVEGLNMSETINSILNQLNEEVLQDNEELVDTVTFKSINSLVGKAFVQRIPQLRDRSKEYMSLLRQVILDGFKNDTSVFSKADEKVLDELERGAFTDIDTQTLGSLLEDIRYDGADVSVLELEHFVNSERFSYNQGNQEMPIDATHSVFEEIEIPDVDSVENNDDFKDRSDVAELITEQEIDQSITKSEDDLLINDQGIHESEFKELINNKNRVFSQELNGLIKLKKSNLDFSKPSVIELSLNDKSYYISSELINVPDTGEVLNFDFKELAQYSVDSGEYRKFNEDEIKENKLKISAFDGRVFKIGNTILQFDRGGYKTLNIENISSGADSIQLNVYQ